MRWQIIALSFGNDSSPSLQVGRMQLHRLFGKGKWQVKSLPPQKAERLAGFLLSAWEGTLVRARCTKDLSPLKDFNEVVFSQLLK